MNSEALAVEVDFGKYSDSSGCTKSGESNDSDCSTRFTYVPDDDVRSSTITIYAQASADRGCPYVLVCNPTASANLSIDYSVLFEVRRAVTVTPSLDTDGGFTIAIPRPTLEFRLEVYGQLGVNGSMEDLGWNGVRAITHDFLSDGYNKELSLYAGNTIPYKFYAVPLLPFFIAQLAGDSSKAYEIPEGANIGEISDGIDIPFDEFKTWTDDLPPFINYHSFLDSGGFFQRDYGYVDITTRLSAKSDNGDERIVCLGLKSGLSSFIVDYYCIPGPDASIKLTATVKNFLPPYVFTVAGSAPPDPAPDPVAIPALAAWALITLALLLALLGFFQLNTRKKNL